MDRTNYPVNPVILSNIKFALMPLYLRHWPTTRVGVVRNAVAAGDLILY